MQEYMLVDHLRYMYVLSFDKMCCETSCISREVACLLRLAMKHLSGI